MKRSIAIYCHLSYVRIISQVQKLLFRGHTTKSIPFHSNSHISLEFNEKSRFHATRDLRLESSESIVLRVLQESNTNFITTLCNKRSGKLSDFSFLKYSRCGKKYFLIVSFIYIFLLMRRKSLHFF